MTGQAHQVRDTSQLFEADSYGCGAGVLALRGELDLAGAPVLRRALDALTRTPGERLVLDVSQLTFIDASGIRAVARVRARLLDEGADAVVRHPQPAVRRTLELCDLGGWLETPDEVDLMAPLGSVQ